MCTSSEFSYKLKKEKKKKDCERRLVYFKWMVSSARCIML